MSSLNLSLFRNFALKKEDISKVIRAAHRYKGLSKDKEILMMQTSLGTEKVRPFLRLSNRSGLIKENQLTPEGKLILELDPILENLCTDWFMHFYLSLGDRGLATPPQQPSDWGGWTYFVYEFVREYRTFTKSDILQHATLTFNQDKLPIIKKYIPRLLRAYTEPYALAGCKFLILEDGQYHTDQSRRPNPYLVGYFLAKLWERDFPQEGSVLTDSLLTHPMGLGPVLGLDQTGVQEELNRLESLGIIEQRRAVPPFQVVPRWTTPLDLLEKAYDCDR
jgi:hypothetical protein